MRKIGLTGGIGSGKSTVAKMLSQRGLALIDADAMSRALTAPGGLAMPAIVEALGPELMAADGGLDRNAMRDLMLRDAKAKAALERIVHPLVGEGIAARLEESAQQGARAAVLDIPLLVESGTRWRSNLDWVWVVDCLPSTQSARVAARNGWPTAQIDAVIAAQASRAARLTCADAVIFNDGLTLSDLEVAIDELLCQHNLLDSNSRRSRPAQFGL